MDCGPDEYEDEVRKSDKDETSEIDSYYDPDAERGEE